MGNIECITVDKEINKEQLGNAITMCMPDSYDDDPCNISCGPDHY